MKTSEISLEEGPSDQWKFPRTGNLTVLRPLFRLSVELFASNQSLRATFARQSTSPPDFGIIR